MVGGNVIRGSRVGSGPARMEERVPEAARQAVTYWCVNGHRTEPLFSAEVEVPELWECPQCGCPAGTDPDNPPVRPRAEPYKSHLAYVKERRSEEDAAAILAEALANLRRRRSH